MKTTTGTAPVLDNSINDYRLEELESALLDRDRVVQLLTEQLEQAADQLDRLQRMGSERRSPGGSSSSADLFEGQQALLGQLNRVLGDWEELQAAQTLTRIERQVSEIKDFLAVGSSNQPTKSVAELWSSNDSSRRSVAEAAAPPPPPPSPTDSMVAISGWEAIKAAMLAGESIPEVPPVTRTADSRTRTEAVESVTAVEVRCDTPPADTTLLSDPPPALDLEMATPEELREAVQSRDDYIARLVRKLASAPQPRNPDWGQLHQVPDELRLELESLRDHWQSRIRTAEVDLALQRARLAREESRLQTQATAVERQLKRLGMEGDEPAAGDLTAKESKNSPSTSRRWMNFLQRSNS